MRRPHRRFHTLFHTLVAVLATAASASAAPLAVDDVVPTEPGTNVVGDLFANDDATSLARAELVAEPVYGSLTGDGALYGGVTPWGTFEYEPAPGFTGVDVFAYRLVDDDGPSAAATVFVVVGPVQILSRPGSEPRLTDLGLELPDFNNRTSAVLGDKNDVAGQRFTVRPSTKGADFNFVADAPTGDPALETWDPGSAGTDATVYRLNDRPWQQFALEPAGGGAFRVLSHFTGYALTADGLDAGANVSAMPADGSAAQEWLLAGPGQVVPPLAFDDAVAADPADLDGVIAGNVLSNDVATSFDFFAFLASRPEHGELVGIGQTIYDGIAPWGFFQYRPAPGFRGIDRFTYYVLNSGGGTPSRIATVEIQVGDNAPLAADDVVATAVDTNVSSNVLWNDRQGIPGAFFDPGSSLAVAPLHGQLVGIGQTIYGGITPWGTFEYQPDPGFTGIDVFGYRVFNNGEVSGIATVTVVVGDVRISSAADPALSIETPASANRTALELGANGSFAGQQWRPQASGDFFRFNLQSLLDPGAGAFMETWDPGAAGTLATLYRLNDLDWQRFDLLPTEDGGSVEIRSRYTGYLVSAAGAQAGDAVVAEPALPDDDSQRWLLAPLGAEPAPFARDDVFTAAPDALFAGNVLANDDSNGFDLAAFVATQPEHGQLVGLYQSLYGGVAPWGAFEYQPPAGFTGVDSFTYFARSSGNGTPSRLVTVTIRVE
ncbi:MAG: Ig-like domain-containing protein [Acidobacteriota bacterium]